jgi:hypothetical protein
MIMMDYIMTDNQSNDSGKTIKNKGRLTSEAAFIFNMEHLTHYGLFVIRVLN